MSLELQALDVNAGRRGPRDDFVLLGDLCRQGAEGRPRLNLARQHYRTAAEAGDALGWQRLQEHFGEPHGP